MSIQRFIEEDLGSGDITSHLLLSNEKAKAAIFSKGKYVVAGLEEVKEVFAFFGLKVKSKYKDGNSVRKGDSVIDIEGNAKAILAAERLALNFLMKMSGIATQTKKLVNVCKKLNPKIQIAATRKTTPGFRYYEKKAIIIGGGLAHRYGLYDGIIIKDNHLKIVGSIKKALITAKKHKPNYKIEIEVRNIKEALEAVKSGADIVMLDNFSPLKAKEASQRIRALNRDVQIEISGGITLKNIKNYAKYADIISLGWLTHSVPAANYSLEILKLKR